MSSSQLSLVHLLDAPLPSPRPDRCDLGSLGDLGQLSEPKDVPLGG